MRLGRQPVLFLTKRFFFLLLSSGDKPLFTWKDMLSTQVIHERRTHGMRNEVDPWRENVIWAIDALGGGYPRRHLLTPLSP